MNELVFIYVQLFYSYYGTISVRRTISWLTSLNITSSGCALTSKAKNPSTSSSSLDVNLAASVARPAKGGVNENFCSIVSPTLMSEC